MAVLLCAIFLLLRLKGALNQSQQLQLISKSHSPHLETYSTYSDSVIMHFTVPDNTINASFVFAASQQDLSIFGCTVRNVSLYLKHGAPPVINPDGSPFPEEFRNISRPPTYNLEFLTDQKQSYINVSSPEPGMYFAAIFLAYEDPRFQKISQQGLTQSCRAYIDASVYVSRVENPTIISENRIVEVVLSNASRHFTFLAPEGLDSALVDVEIADIPSKVKRVVLRIGARSPPTEKVFLVEKLLNASDPSAQIAFGAEPRTWYYLAVSAESSSDASEKVALNLHPKFFSSKLPSSDTFVAQKHGNATLYNMSVVHKYYQMFRLADVQPYKQFDLVRDSATESFAFFYKLQPELASNSFVPINVTSEEFSVLKFELQRGVDIGGTLQYILAFKPRISRTKHTLRLLPEPESHTIVGCIQRNHLAVPVWPKYCASDEDSFLAPIVLNATVSNSTVLIPFPESGDWYASFKLFCGSCEPCDCPAACQAEYERCTIGCELSSSENCVAECSSKALSSEKCAACDCDGPCRRNSSRSCSSSVIFDVSSRPCYFGECGKQGECGLFISDGVAYSSCRCSNNYRGFDCSDGSLATPYYLVLIEFLLLILSNVFFLPATYIAFRRRYYVETLAYFSIFLSSSFYHACDAGENILSFCVFRLGALQFADFFSALLAIWLTLLAIADLPQLALSLLQMGGSIIIAFCVNLNRYALWIFALPSVVGVVIIGVSWYLKYRKYRCRFVDRRYLYVMMPIGAAVVAIGLGIYGILQTQDNYKYLHSLWHIIMATGVFFLLPQQDTFEVAVLLS
ncbi:post-GPI attachment to proteins factor 6 isoform X1 [Dendroctonus ponderosae]|uniref:post-GPI attachment to proteins factor 6 isoform X1 n=1 Tax=Dendroctonus ponderosae TaxID=77166 RepID=UPI002034FA6F|nr:post-GPI attachment to proteins factor 6 isoform X1 [Dendroctonus ponderosae]KAH1006200.1 hypothetical protein HUJ05_006953 [Dendroctonus ponderosae]